MSVLDELRARLPRRTIWSPQPGPQHALIDCDGPEIFFGGARGGGKTDGILGKWSIREQELGSNFNAVGLRPTSVSWDDAVERSKSIFGPLGGKFNETKLVWRMPHGGRARFAYLERVSDADQYQGKNVTDVWIEEVGLYPTSVAARFLPRPIARMKAVLRAPRGITTQMVLSGNPGGPGQHWISTRYGLIPFPARPKIVTVYSEAGEVTQAAVIPSRVEDNHMIDQAAYVSNLRQAGSEQLVRAWLRGDWSAVEGAFFDCWDERRHVVEPFDIPPHWLRFLSMDWGFAAPHSVGWWAVASDPTHAGGMDIPRGAIVRYREWYGAGGSRLPAESLARGILDRETELRSVEDAEITTVDEAVISYGVLDPSAFDVSRGPSIAEQMARAGVLFRRADNRRVRGGGSVSGWDQMRGRLLGDVDGNPMIVAFNTCVDSIRTIPVLQHDPDKPEDLNTHEEDHCFAAFTLVDTDCGPIRIDEIVPGKHRIWSAGQWRRDFSARLVSTDDELIRLDLEDGREIWCTLDHRIMDFSDEWRYAGSFKPGDLLACDLSLSARPFRNSMETAITSVGRIFRGEASGFIGKFGREISSKFRAGHISTIEMAIVRTTRQKTWSAFDRLNIYQVNMAQRLVSAAATALPRPAMQLDLGMVRQMASDGIASISSAISGPQWMQGLWSNALRAGVTMSAVQRALRRLDFVQVPVKPVRCVGVEPVGRSATYCLDVPETRAFTIEGGIIVHNCADDWRYACMSRPWVRPLPDRPETRILEVGPGNQVTLDDLWEDRTRRVERRI